MTRYRKPLHPHGEHWLHGDGRPRLVKVLEVGANAQLGKVKIRDRASVYWIDAKHVTRSAKAPRISTRERAAREAAAERALGGKVRART